MNPKPAHYGMLSWSGYWQVAAGNHVTAFLPADFSLKPKLWAEIRSTIKGKSGGEESLV